MENPEEMMRSAGGRIGEFEARLIDDLLDLTRISRGKLQLKRHLCDAHELLQHTVEIVRSQITGKDLRLSLDLSARSHVVNADSARLEQVFWNILKNASKFTSAAGEISVRSYNATPGVLAFEISDTGPGSMKSCCRNSSPPSNRRTPPAKAWDSDSPFERNRRKRVRLL